MAQTKKNIYEQLEPAKGGTVQAQQAANTDVGSMQQPQMKAAQPVYNIDPSKITQSFYTKPTNADNYESGRPLYEQSQAVKDAASALQQHQQNKPGEYQGQYEDEIQQLIDQTLNRQKFSYDFSQDPMYAAYAQQYERGGKMAMDDAIARASALTSGYGNSWAQTAGQQTQQRYMEELAAMIPELRDAAYQMYRDEGDNMRQNLAMLQGQDDRDYGRYRDTVTDWQTDLGMLYSMYTDMSEAEYNRYLNDRAAWEADRNYWYQQAYDRQQQANWQAQFDAQYGGSSSGGGGKPKKNGSGDENGLSTIEQVADYFLGTNLNNLKPMKKLYDKAEDKWILR